MGAGPLLGCVYFFGWGVLEGQIIIIFVLTVRRIHRFVIWFHFSILKNNSVLNKIHTPYTHLPIIASLKYRHSCVGQDPPTEKWLPALQERRRINFRVKLSLSPTVTHALCFFFLFLPLPTCSSWLGVLLSGGVHLSGVLRDPPQHPRNQQSEVPEPVTVGGPGDGGRCGFVSFFYSASHQYMD